MVRWLTLLLMCMFAVGCTTPRSQAPVAKPAEVEERAVVGGEALPLPEQRDISVKPLPGQRSESPVVKRLLASADTQQRSGDVDGAANSLERALRIEPRNALLWSRLANVRFTQKDWRQAVQLAAKSNTLAANNRNLRRQNWNLMASAYDALGDEASAQKFREKLRSE